MYSLISKQLARPFPSSHQYLTILRITDTKAAWFYLRFCRKHWLLYRLTAICLNCIPSVSMQAISMFCITHVQVGDQVEFRHVVANSWPICQLPGQSIVSTATQWSPHRLTRALRKHSRLRSFNKRFSIFPRILHNLDTKYDDVAIQHLTLQDRGCCLGFLPKMLLW